LGSDAQPKLKRTPKNLYKVPNEQTPLLGTVEADDSDDVTRIEIPDFVPEEETGSGDRIVTIAIYVNLAANTALLILKIIVTILTSSLSVIASLVDAALDFLSTAIVWITTRLISQNDQYAYPVGRRRLEPIGVLVFSIIMVTSFFQVALEGVSRLSKDDHRIVQLTIPAIAIMSFTVIIKFACWVWCRLIKNSSVQALAQDAMTDVVFNIFSIIFPLGESNGPPFRIVGLGIWKLKTNVEWNSGLLLQDMVSRRSWWHPPLFLCHHQLVAHIPYPYPEPHRGGCLCGRAQYPALSNHAFR